ncbi:hypothetical protein F511_12289 [Dorcoceras hygrometricum]|uniref:Uncharacterized protein n=1 Tax=Dorcoceras hygrometricum TaxID=472368 RepID=A0A2Z7BQC8_9LAMI|nr:hypothetical protein F511_12289 [Dorcoceras hygrometricum]
MQHAIINAMKCMRAIKDRIARPVYQLAIISIEPLYHAQQVSRWKSSVRDLQDPSAYHSSVAFRHDKSVGHHSDDSAGLFRHDKSVGQSQRGSQSAIIITSLIAMFTLKAIKSAQFVPSTADYTSTDSYKGTHHSLRSEPCSSSTCLPKLETTRNAHPETQTSRRTNELLCTRTQQLRTSSPTLIQGFKWVAIERETHKESSATKTLKSSAENGGNRRNLGHGEQ